MVKRIEYNVVEYEWYNYNFIFGNLLIMIWSHVLSPPEVNYQVGILYF